MLKKRSFTNARMRRERTLKVKERVMREKKSVSFLRMADFRLYYYTLQTVPFRVKLNLFIFVSAFFTYHFKTLIDPFKTMHKDTHLMYMLSNSWMYIFLQKYICIYFCRNIRKEFVNKNSKFTRKPIKLLSHLKPQLIPLNPS